MTRHQNRWHHCWGSTHSGKLRLRSCMLKSLGGPSVLEDARGPGCVWLGVLLGAKAPRDDVTMWSNRVGIVRNVPKCPVPG